MIEYYRIIYPDCSEKFFSFVEGETTAADEFLKITGVNYYFKGELSKLGYQLILIRKEKRC